MGVLSRFILFYLLPHGGGTAWACAIKNEGGPDGFRRRLRSLIVTNSLKRKSPPPDIGGLILELSIT
jgi:hypothetical protein